MVLRKVYTMFDAATASEGDWIKLDYRFEEANERTLAIKLTVGDTITLEGTHVIAKDTPTLDGIITAGDIHNLKEYVEDFSDILNGQWTFVRIKKTGATGAAKVTAVL
tara:strand:+ start:9045 stop:9368 length:324 start_codon:yes stop_codon:yes gene_type:complete